jgi:integrase
VKQVHEFMAEWIEVHKTSVRTRTAQNYLCHIRNYITPVIGDKQMSSVTPVDVAQVVVYMQNKGIAASTIRLMQTILRKAFEDAVAWGYIDRNVTKATAKVHVPSKSVDAIPMSDVQAILASLKGNKFEAVIRIMLAQGLRRGEACALRWEDVDFEQKTLRVVRQVVRVDGVGLVVQEPKTAASIRLLPTTKTTYDLLTGMWGQEKTEGYIFPGAKGLPIDPHRVYNAFQDVLDSAGLPGMGLHQLRHAFGTILRAQGVGERTLMDLFGHTSIRMTSRYGGVVDSLKVDAANFMDTALGGV